MPRLHSHGLLAVLVSLAAPAALAAQTGATPPPATTPQERIRGSFAPPTRWRLTATADAFGTAESRFDAGGPGPAPEGARDVRVRRLWARLSSPAWILGGGRTILTHELTAERLGIDYGPRAAPTATLAPDDLNLLQSDLVVNQRLSAAWRLTTLFQAALVTDGANLGTGHLRLTAVSWASKQVRPNLQWGVGLALVNHTPRVLPVVRVLWADGRGHRADVLLPSRAEYWWELSPRVEVGGALRVTGNRWTLGALSARPFEQAVYVQGTVAPAIHWRPSATLSVIGEAGVAPLRVLRFIDTEGVAREAAIGPGVSGFLRTTVRTTF
ncbi:MAG: DUF6268 family outer membrane beta-barrel protein [Gemmatimonadales bacterium]|nr:DUF6268 family outer membrane beta-barrel protein [Gemmatimonadales bacterium]